MEIHKKIQVAYHHKCFILDPLLNSLVSFFKTLKKSDILFMHFLDDNEYCIDFSLCVLKDLKKLY